MPKFPCIKPQFKRIARFAPLIGLIIGGLQVSIWLIFSNLGWSNQSLAFVIIAIDIFITGGLHLDGLIDTTDGIAAGKERQIEAMKDSSAGAIGVISLAAILLVQAAAILRLSQYIIIAIPITRFIGRLYILWAIRHFPYIQKEGMGKIHRSNWASNYKELKPSLITILISLLLVLILPINNSLIFLLIISALLAMVPAFLIMSSIGSILGGHNGDSYGASLVLIETTTLVIFGITLPVI